MLAFVIVISAVGFLLLAWFDWSARRRVRSIRESEAERVPYAAFHSEEDGR
ncbi:hypothetical protein ACIQC7_27690 [Kitasatospora sp. NPDC088556]|uniref:hypothetical protein n=1 Tax=Kitasatospora sp. NPDC088556 TaxID=3364076 RepID=UPI0038033C33